MTFDKLYAAFQSKCASDPQLRSLKKKINSGKADFSDTAAYSERISTLLGQTLSKYIDGIPEGSREQICKWLLREQYKDTNTICEVVQEALDEAQGIHLTPQKAPFPAERVQAVAHALEDLTVKPETIRRRANAPVANVAKSFHDDYIKTNARVRSDLGLKATITRFGADCCAWCAAVSGKYRFGEQPEDIFRRHDNCNCTILYDTQVLRGVKTSDGKRSKTWEEVDPAKIGQNPPAVLSQAEAQKLQENALNQLTKPGQGDIINTREMANGMRKSPFIPLSDNDKAHLLEEISAIKANPEHFAFRDGFGTGYSDERDVVFVSSNVFPPSDGSNHPRDLMSERAVLAHEYYGHRENRGTKLPKGSWNDEFRASYTAAKQCPNLTDEDRMYLILDAIERAHEAGVSIRYNSFIRRVLYG